jgi:ubiquinone/menaquinone biosynthesis C-methylase UbiE
VSYDATLCECPVSTFEEAPLALAEIARLPRPGGRLAMTNVLLRRDLAASEVVAAVDRLTTARAPPENAALAEAVRCSRWILISGRSSGSSSST